MLGTILSNNMSDSAGKISPIFVVSEMEANIEFVKEDVTFGSVSTKNESIHHHASFYTVSQKKPRHQTLSHNFTNYYPIFKIFSPADSIVNLQQTHV